MNTSPRRVTGTTRRRHRRGGLSSLGLALAAACGSCAPEAPQPEAPRVCLGEPALDPEPLTPCHGARPAAPALGPCRLPGRNPPYLLVTTTDFATGALSLVHVADRRVDADVALGSTDALPFFHRGTVFMLHRFGLDYVDVLDPCDGFVSRGQRSLRSRGVPSPNPQWLAFRDDGLAFVTQLGHHTLAVLDLSRPDPDVRAGEVDLSAFADADGKPEAGLAVACGDTLFVAAQRLDDSFSPVAPDLLIPVDMRSCATYPAPIELAGSWVKQVRADPLDASGRTLLLLTTGIERVDVATGRADWLVHESVFAAERLGSFNLLDFDLSDDGLDLYVAATTPTFSAVRIWRVARGGDRLEAWAGELNAVEKSLEIIGAELWFGDTTFGREGLRIFDLGGAPVAGPLSVGLPPYRMLAVP